MPAIHYLGEGAYGVVFEDRRWHCFKVGRDSPSAQNALEDEAEWLQAAARIPYVRDHVVKNVRYHARANVIERECVEDKPDATYGYRAYDVKKTLALHNRIGHLMARQAGWWSPEYKRESYAIVRGRGPVLRDASLAQRVGRNLVKYTLDVLAGRRRSICRGEEWGGGCVRPGDLAYELRREIAESTVPREPGCRVLDRLREAGVKNFTDCPAPDEIGRRYRPLVFDGARRR